MNRYQNLILLDKWGILHPRWEMVKSGKDLKKFDKIKDYCGWTVKVLYTKRETARPALYVNWLPKAEVPEKINQFVAQAKKDFIIVIYPSWIPVKSGTLLINKKKIIIEACKGSLEKLMRRGCCAVGLIYDLHQNLQEWQGNPKFFSAQEKQKIFSVAGKVKKRDVILEWAFGKQQEFIVYKLEDLKQVGKLLLAKYS